MLKYFLAICLYCQYKAFELMILAGLNLMKEYLCWGMHEMKKNTDSFSSHIAQGERCVSVEKTASYFTELEWKWTVRDLGLRLLVRNGL